MDEREYQQQRMLHEYDTLRAEILQCYGQQTQLVFGAAIAAAAVIASSLIQSPAVLLGLPTLLLVLIGVCYKSIANYCRIYRIGAYIVVVHEQQGMPVGTFKPGPSQAAWHSRWRLAIGNKSIPATGGVGAEAEAWFLLFLGMAAWLLLCGASWEKLRVDLASVAAVLSSVCLTVVLVYFSHQLLRVFKVSARYEQGFRHLLEEEAAKPEAEAAD